MSQIDRPLGAEHGGARILLVNSTSTLIARLLSLTAFLWVYQHLLHRIDPAEHQLLLTLAPNADDRQALKRLLSKR